VRPTVYKLKLSHITYVCDGLLSGSESKLKEGLPQECQEACICALTKFQDVYDHMQKRSISVTELWKIKENEKQVRRLCEAAIAYEGKKENGHLLYEAVDCVLSQIVEEFDAFKEHRSHLLHLSYSIPDVVQGKLIFLIGASLS